MAAMATGQRWNEKFEAVRRFRNAHGRWPYRSEGALGKWCDNQRQAKKGKGTNRISPAQIAKLDGIGFDWDPSATAKQQWNANFDEVRRFRDEHGRWPKRREGALGSWCDNQRTAKKGKGHCRISPAQIAKLDGIGFDWGTTRAAKATVEQGSPAAEPQQQKKAVPPRKRVHEADPEGRPPTRHATEPHPRPMAVAAAFWTATPVAAAHGAATTAAPNAGAPAVRERAGRPTPLKGSTIDYGAVIKSSF